MRRKHLMELMNAVDVQVEMTDGGRAWLTLRESTGTSRIEIPVKVGWWFSMALDAARSTRGR